MWIIIIWPPKIPHQKLTTLNKHHIVQRLHNSVEHFAARLGGKVWIFLLNGRGDFCHLIDGELLAFGVGERLFLATCQ